MNTTPFALLACMALTAAAAPSRQKGEQEIVSLVKEQLKDPESARFRDIKKMENGNFCGWVNAKNSYGGYTGYQAFFVASRTKEVTLVPPELSEPGIC
jgi:hypothetical protein